MTMATMSTMMSIATIVTMATMITISTRKTISTMMHTFLEYGKMVKSSEEDLH